MKNKHSFKKKKIMPWFIPLIVFLLVISQQLKAQTVSVHITKGDKRALIATEDNLVFTNIPLENPTITIDENTQYQSIDGLGYALTQGSAEALLKLTASRRNILLYELFSPAGNNISMIRISIGASDLSNSVYFYNDVNGDVAMNSFSLEGPDTTYLIPIINEILAINPNVKILATPWSAPTWMKSNGSSIGGNLLPQYYQAYANYFVSYLEAMNDQGIPIWAITPQNEPENPFNNPSMLMDANEQLDFINNHLGPALAASPFSPKIIAFDHNCDNTDYPINVLNNSSYVDGAGFHLYAGKITAMSTVKEETGKNVYFTEQFTGIDGDFDGDLGWHMENVVIGSLRNWSKTVLEWNLADFPNSFPRTDGGCEECLGAITVKTKRRFQRNVSYYIIGQLSRFLATGAERIASNNSGIDNVALRNPDGQKVLLTYNKFSESKDLTVNWSGKSFSYTIPARTAATFIWDGDFIPQIPLAPIQIKTKPDENELLLEWEETVEATSYDIQRATSENGPFTTIASAIPTNSYLDSGLTTDTRYYYRIRAINSVGEGPYSAVISDVPRLITIYAFRQIEAENFNDSEGIQVEDTADLGGGQNVGFTDTDDFLLFKNVDFGSGAANLIARIASNADFTGGIIEFRLNSPTGTLISTIDLGNTGGYQLWETRTTPTVNVGGMYDLYLVFKGGAGIGNLNWFQFIAPSNPPEGELVLGGTYIIRNKNSGKVCDVEGNSQDNGARIQQWDSFQSNNQKWIVQSAGAELYKITAVSSLKVMDVVGATDINNTEIQQWDYFESDNQKWRIEFLDDGYFNIISLISGKALGIANEQTANGDKIVQLYRNGSDNQKWSFELFDTPNPPQNQAVEPLVNVYPNPSVERNFSIQIPSEVTGEITLQILDMNGQIVHKQSLMANQNSIELPRGVRNGILFLKINGDTFQVTKKIVLK